jgi:hypothetical protein
MIGASGAGRFLPLEVDRPSPRGLHIRLQIGFLEGTPLRSLLERAGIVVDSRPADEFDGRAAGTIYFCRDYCPRIVSR